METQVDRVLKIFEQIDSVPRKSKNEAKIAAWISEWAIEHRLSHERDNAGNLVLRVPPTSGMERAPTIVLQGHMDMVCEKRPDVSHNFETDPIRLVRDGEWLHADGTTLGADNGIAVAMALAVASDRSIEHPALELLFTVDEESGLTGALNLSESLVNGRILLNIDSEDEGVFTIGSAGGRRTYLHKAVRTTPRASNTSYLLIRVDGLQGGHSGVDIHKHRANANLLLARICHRLNRNHGVPIVWFESHGADNAIPRSAMALLDTGEPADSLLGEVTEFEKAARNEYRTSEPGLKVSATYGTETLPDQILDSESARQIVDIILTHPNGVLRMSPEIPELVQTSSNVAEAYVKDGEFHIRSLQRSSVQSELDAVLAAIETVSAAAGALLKIESEYPGWEPRLDSPLLKRSTSVYRSRFGKEPVIEAAHAGLECGVIGGKYPGMDMISFGPTIRAPHSPDERLHLPSLERTWQFLVDLLASFRN